MPHEEVSDARPACHRLQTPSEVAPRHTLVRRLETDGDIADLQPCLDVLSASTIWSNVKGDRRTFAGEQLPVARAVEKEMTRLTQLLGSLMWR